MLKENIDIQNLHPACGDHKSVLLKIDILEKDIGEIKTLLNDKVESTFIDQICDQRTRELEIIREDIIRLSSADIKHSEALAGLDATFKAFKEMQGIIMNDISVISSAQLITSTDISSIKTSIEHNEKEKNKPEKESDNPWYINIFTTNKPLIYAMSGLIFALVYVIISEKNEIIKVLQQLSQK